MTSLETAAEELTRLDRELHSLILVETVRRWLNQPDHEAARIAPPQEFTDAVAVAERMRSLITSLPSDALRAIADVPHTA